MNTNVRNTHRQHHEHNTTPQTPQPPAHTTQHTHHHTYKKKNTNTSGTSRKIWWWRTLKRLWMLALDDVNADTWSSETLVEAKSTGLLRFRMMSLESVFTSRSKNKMVKSGGRISDVLCSGRVAWNRRRSEWIRVEYSPRIYCYIARFSSTDPGQLVEWEHRARTIFWQDHLHVDVQWHGLDKKKYWRNMCFEFRKDKSYAQKFSARSLTFIGLGQEMKWFGTRDYKPEGKCNSTTVKNGTVLPGDDTPSLHKCFDSWSS